MSDVIPGKYDKLFCSTDIFWILSWDYEGYLCKFFWKIRYYMIENENEKNSISENRYFVRKNHTDRAFDLQTIEFA